MDCTFYSYDGERINACIDRRDRSAQIDGFHIYGDDYTMMFGQDGEDLKGKTRTEIVRNILPEVYFWWFTL